MFRDNPEAAAFIAIYDEYNSTEKTLSTYVTGFLRYLRPDGRFHPTYMLFRGGYGNKDDDSGTNSGRTSLKDPAAQTIPKRTRWTKKLRKAYIAPPGYVILQLDFNQGELRITACVADEPTMIQAYLNEMDLHSITAARINGYELEVFNELPEELRDPLRSRGKAGNFGLIYGMGENGFREYAWASYGVKLTAEEAYSSREGFFELYNRLPAWHDEYRNIAHKYAQVVSPLGRVRHLPLINSRDRDVVAQAERQAINAPVQSTLSDMMQLAMTLIDKEYGHEDIHMFLMTHDSVALYVPEDDAIEWAKRCKVIMENLPLNKFGWKPQLPFTADAEYGPNLAELKKLKGI